MATRNRIRGEKVKTISEEAMKEQFWTKATILLGALVAFMVGCGGAVESKSSMQTAATSSPFGEPGDSSDLKADSEGDYDDSGGESYDSNDLRVPGSQYGTAGKGKGSDASGKKCPKGKKGNKCRKEMTKKIPFSEEIAKQMEGIPWGMTDRAVMAAFEKKIRESYKEPLKSAGGAIEEDNIRNKMMQEIKKLKKSYVKFDGKRTGFEGVMIEDEFTHNNGESMLMWDAGKFVEYLFFFDGRFWKRLRSFRKDTLEGEVTFETYVQTLTNRFGEGKEIRNEAGELTEIMWQNDDTYMAARDKSGFYGVYCLVFMAKAAQDNLARLRTNQDRRGGGVDDEVSGVVSSVTSGDLSDQHTSVIDGYTGEEMGGGSSSIDLGDSVMGKKKKASEGEQTNKKEDEDIKVDDDIF
jgi:hypothetical protein